MNSNSLKAADENKSMNNSADTRFLKPLSHHLSGYNSIRGQLIQYEIRPVPKIRPDTYIRYPPLTAKKYLKIIEVLNHIVGLKICHSPKKVKPTLQDYIWNL